MAHKINAYVEVLKSAKAQGDYVATSVNGTNFDSSFSAVINTYTRDEVLKIISVLPVSNFNYIDNTIIATGWKLDVQIDYDVILSGSFVTIPKIVLDLNDFKANPASTTFHMYVIMDQGIAKFYLTDTVIAESGTSAYNTLWIGTVVTDTTHIVYNTIAKRTRLDVFGNSSTARGSSFPVSTGLPSQSGTISW